ncbi:MAG: hypothetical protein JWM59_4553 [Verrucomicrobiales bacterium]|nr:hypothetical protein [Verrucomicrobiales bacterium]
MGAATHVLQFGNIRESEAFTVMRSVEIAFRFNHERNHLS